jgi:hypothetical protein
VPSSFLGAKRRSIRGVRPTAIEQLLDRYVEAYSAKDYPKLREQLQAPFVRFPAGWEVLETLDDAMQFYREQRDALDEQNYARSQFVESRITPLAGDRALVGQDVSALPKGRDCPVGSSRSYVVCKSSGAWKVCGLFPRDLEGFGKVY